MAVRISGGALARRTIQVPPGEGVRPTSDRVRESLFAVLGAAVEAQAVLDLFAGSGSLGIESLSRGAARAVFVERDRRTLAVLRRNLESLGLTARSEVLATEASHALRRLTRGGARFGLVLLDPPYASELLSESLTSLADGALLDDEALVVCEHPSRQAPGENYGVLRRREQRRYGDTTVTVFARVPDPGEDGER